MNDKEFDSFIKNNLNEHDSHVQADLWKRIQVEKDFDSFIKQNLNTHSSDVPTNTWNKIKAEKDFDPFIKQNLDNYSSLVPANMWSRIQYERKKERRPLVWWWLAAILLLSLGIAGTWFFTKKSSDDITNNANRIIAPSAKDVLAAASNAPTIKSSPNCTASNQDYTKQDTTNVPDTVIFTKPNNAIKSKSRQSNKNISADNYQTSNLGKQPSNPQDKSTNQPPFNKKSGVLGVVKNKNTSKNNIKSEFDTNSDNESNKSNSTKKDIAQTMSNSGISSNKKQTETVFDIANNYSNQQTAAFTLQSGNTNSNIENEKQLSLNKLILASFAKDKMMPKQLLHAMAKSTVIACPPLGRSGRNDWYIEAFISPDMVLKTLQDKPFGKNIQSGMDSTLHRQVSFSAGVNIIKSLGKNWLVKTGVQYAQINELFKYSSVNEIKTTTVITVRNVIISPGDTLFIRDTSSVQTVGSITKQTQNRYRQWDIPLIFSYELGGKDFRLNANFGITANIRSSYQGNMLDTLQKAIDISNYNNTGIYKTNIGLSAYLGLSLIKPINDYMDFLVEPHARFNLRNITTNAALFNQKNTILGLSLGIRYKINGKGQR